MNTPLNAPVLVVDDEEDLRDLIEMTLLKMGLEVDTADGVNAAKKKLDAQPYALVLTDMRMPDGSGLEVVEYLQEKPRHSHCHHYRLWQCRPSRDGLKSRRV